MGAMMQQQAMTAQNQKQQSMNITYETLFDILRAERRRDDVQELPVTFFEDVVQYLKQKKELIIKKEHESGIDSFDEIKAMKIQYENAQKIIKEIYERREKKILFMALNRSRTKIALQQKYLLQQEQEFYEQLTRLLDAYRGDVAEKLMNGIQPKEQIAAVLSSLKQEEKKESVFDAQQQIPPASPEAAEKAFSRIKFLQDMGQFIGPELETYGPFAPETVAEIPTKIAAIFIAKGAAEEMKE